MKIKEIKAWKWKCPYCHTEGICIDHEKADSELRHHIAECYSNPARQDCGSCTHCNNDRCILYDMKTRFSAFLRNKCENYTCSGWECKPHLKKIQDKLRGEK